MRYKIIPTETFKNQVRALQKKYEMSHMRLCFKDEIYDDCPECYSPNKEEISEQNNEYFG